MLSLKQQVLNSVKWNMIGTVAVQGTTLLSGIIVARLLQPADYGLAALAISIVTFLSVLTEAGFGQALIAQSEVDFKVSDSVICLMLIVGLVMFTILQLVARPLAGFYGLPTLEPAVRVASIGGLLSTIVSVPQALLQKQLRFDAINKVVIISALLGALAAVALAISGLGFWALIMPVILSTSVKIMGFFITLRYFPQLRLNWHDIRSTTHFGITILLSHLAKFAIDRGTFLILGMFWPSATVGLFQFARNYAQQPFNILVGQFSNVLFPAFTYVRNDHQRFKRAFLDVTRISIVIIFPIYILLIGLAPQLIPWVFGSQWNGAVAAFEIASTFMFVGSFGVAVTSALYAGEKPEISLYTNLFRLVDIPIIIGLLSLSGQLEIVMGGVTISLIVIASGYYFYCYRWLGITWREFVETAWSPLISALAMTFCLVVGRYLLHVTGTCETATVALPAFAGIGLYLFFMRSDIVEITQMLLRRGTLTSGRV
jgi:O-antigen/teichoic acid export membrane protein